MSLPFSFLRCSEFERNAPFSLSIKRFPKRGRKALRYMVLFRSKHISAEDDNPSIPGPSSLFWLGIWWEHAMALDGTDNTEAAFKKVGGLLRPLQIGKRREVSARRDSSTVECRTS